MQALAMGLMSGTSIDGIDVAVVQVSNQKLIYGHTYHYSNELRQDLKQVMLGHAFNMNFFASLHKRVGREFAAAASHAISQLPAAQQQAVKVIGSHGQTLCHNTVVDVPYTWQIGCPHEIYQRCQIPVVYDFRGKNVTQGGQGAPLAPLYHSYLFGTKEDIAVVNIGGISNISILLNNYPVIGYDVGAGNCLLDSWIEHCLGLSFDQNGDWAASGQINDEFLSVLLQDEFIQRKAPKSIGKEHFNLQWLHHRSQSFDLESANIQATLVAFTARVIAVEVKKYLNQGAKVYLCGGGAKNLFLTAKLQNELMGYEVMPTDQLGISSDYLEAMMIAWLAWSRKNDTLHDVALMMGGRDQQRLGLICE
jgi:anhydro-N-acetylmuramic acid kinase